MLDNDKQAREDVFNSYPQSIQAVFKNRHDEIFDNVKVWRIFLAMNLLAFGNGKKPDIGDEDDWLRGVEWSGKHGKRPSTARR